MPEYSKIKIIDRIIDANINRTKEGLRVCEEITRFILNNRSLTVRFKKIRHGIDRAFKLLSPQRNLIKARQTLNDVGKTIYAGELKRKNYQDIFAANIQRVKESMRVLEEFSKLGNTNVTIQFKKIRYDIYELEKKVITRIAPLRHHR